MNMKPTFPGVSELLNGLTEQEQAMLVANPKELKKLASSLVAKDIESTYFVPLADKDVPEKFKNMVPKWRKFASDLGYTGPICWRVREGFTLKEHAPKAGPCYEAFEHLRGWPLNGEATKSAHIFFIPRLVDKSTSKNVDEQMKLLSETRKRYELPEHHLSSFGSTAQLAGLILAHLKCTGDKSSLDRYVVRTDTLLLGCRRLHLHFSGDALDCVLAGFWLWVVGRYDLLGVFPLGVELG